MLQGVPYDSTGQGGWAHLSASFPSADMLLDELQAVVGLLQPLAGPQVAQAMRRIVVDLLTVWATAVGTAFTASQAEGGGFPTNLGELPARDSAGRAEGGCIRQLHGCHIQHAATALNDVGALRRHCAAPSTRHAAAQLR